jgi:ABC-type molybdate transport system permease subunit
MALLDLVVVEEVAYLHTTVDFHWTALVVAQEYTVKVPMVQEAQGTFTQLPEARAAAAEAMVAAGIHNTHHPAETMVAEAGE